MVSFEIKFPVTVQNSLGKKIQIKSIIYFRSPPASLLMNNTQFNFVFKFWCVFKKGLFFLQIEIKFLLQTKLNFSPFVYLRTAEC